MKHKKFGSNGHDVSVIGQGTWYIDRGDRKRAVAALRRGLDLGMTHIDTAEMYGDAELVSPRRSPDGATKSFWSRKCLPSNASRRGTITACERSLKRLKTDRLDCYLLHWRGIYPLPETVAAFEELVGAGKIRSWGVTNFDADDLDELLDVAGEGQDRLQSGALSFAGARDRARGDPVVRRRMASRWSPIRRSVTMIFRIRAARAARCCRRIARRHGVSTRQVALAFLRAIRRCLRFRKRRARNMPPTMPRRAISC